MWWNNTITITRQVRCIYCQISVNIFSFFSILLDSLIYVFTLACDNIRLLFTLFDNSFWLIFVWIVIVIITSIILIIITLASVYMMTNSIQPIHIHWYIQKPLNFCYSMLYLISSLTLPYKFCIGSVYSARIDFGNCYQNITNDLHKNGCGQSQKCSWCINYFSQTMSDQNVTHQNPI